MTSKQRKRLWDVLNVASIDKALRITLVDVTLKSNETKRETQEGDVPNWIPDNVVFHVDIIDRKTSRPLYEFGHLLLALEQGNIQRNLVLALDAMVEVTGKGITSLKNDARLIEEQLTHLNQREQQRKKDQQ